MKLYSCWKHSYSTEKRWKARLSGALLLLSLFLGLSPAWCVQASPFPSLGKIPNDFVPNAYFILKQASGDLNGDGQEDVALVLASNSEKTYKLGDLAPERNLLILLKTPEGYRLATSSNTAVLRKDEGGVWGDPFENISIQKSVLILSFYGGSRERWALSLKFRFQNGDWYLIGKAIGDQDTMSKQSQHVDINYNTGMKQMDVTTEAGLKKSKRLKISSGPLKLSDLTQDNRSQTE